MERTQKLSVSNQLVANKVTILIDDQWLEEITTKMIPFIENDEVFRIIEQDTVALCADCREYLTNEGEVIMESYGCYDQQEYCLNCCGCPEHEGEKWYND